MDLGNAAPACQAGAASIDDGKKGLSKAALRDGTEKLYISAAACESRHPTVANYFTVDLVGLKAITQELADLFGLALPLPFKEHVHNLSTV